MEIFYFALFYLLLFFSLVCAICDGRQHICENLERLGHFFNTYIFIYPHPGTAGFFV